MMTTEEPEMMTFGQLLVGGVATILLLKLLVALVFPMVGIALGFMGLVAKLALVASAVLVALAIVRRWRRTGGAQRA